MKLLRKAGKTSQILNIFIADSSSTTGAGLTGLVFNSAGLSAYYCRPAGSATAITLATQTTTGAYSSGGFVEISSTSMPGWYRFDIPDAAIAASADSVAIHLKGATNMAPLPIEIDLQADVNLTHIAGTVAATPATAGVLDVNVKNINNVAAATPGASGGMLISGSNSGTTTLAALTVTGATTLTGNVAAAAGVTITQSTTNGAGLSITGNGSGAGVVATGGSTGIGISAVGGSSSGSGIKSVGSAGNAIGMEVAGQGSAAGLSITGGATGAGAKFVGGGTSGDGIDITTTSGDGLSITPTAGNAIVATANGTSKHGFVITGGTAGTSDGFKAVAGSGGVPIRGNITGNITGTLDTVTTTTTATNVTTVNGLAAGVITTTSIANDAITAAKVADGAIDAATFAANALDAVWSTATRVLTAGTNIQLPSNGLANVTAWTVAITGNITGNLSGSVGSVAGAVGSVTGNVGGNVVGTVASVVGAVGSVTGNVGGNVVGSIGSLGATAKSDVNAEVVDALATDTYAEPGAVPAATASLSAKVGWMFTLSRNRLTQTSSTQTLRNDADSSDIATASLTDIAGTATRAEWT